MFYLEGESPGIPLVQFPLNKLCFLLINLFLIFITKLWNMYILFSVIFAGKLVSSVNMKLSYTGKCIFSLLCMWTLLVDWFVL